MLNVAAALAAAVSAAKAATGMVCALLELVGHQRSSRRQQCTTRRSMAHPSHALDASHLFCACRHTFSGWHACINAGSSGCGGSWRLSKNPEKTHSILCAPDVRSAV
mmetsp:Transcript_25250/g.68636  ORF Transcript_25250/g.68636 Transcript_25250/m.68636 type:complete len:107 (-) Transcript_25250:13-333(-)